MTPCAKLPHGSRQMQKSQASRSVKRSPTRRSSGTPQKRGAPQLMTWTSPSELGDTEGTAAKGAAA